MTEVPLTTLIAQVSEVVGDTLSANAIAMIAGRLEKEDLPTVEKALMRCMDECRWRLTLADILDRMPSRPIGADAAWEVAMRLNIGDEDATMVAPAAIMEAFPHALWNSGDKIAARVAFKDAYPSALATYGMSHIVSLGNNAAGREPVIMEALKNNLITREVAQLYLPNLAIEIAPLEPPSKTLLLEGPS